MKIDLISEALFSASFFVKNQQVSSVQGRGSAVSEPEILSFQEPAKDMDKNPNSSLRDSDRWIFAHKAGPQALRVSRASANAKSN